MAVPPLGSLVENARRLHRLLKKSLGKAAFQERSKWGVKAACEGRGQCQRGGFVHLLNSKGYAGHCAGLGSFFVIGTCWL